MMMMATTDDSNVVYDTQGSIERFYITATTARQMLLKHSPMTIN
jgi:hypothetical protein